MASCLVWFSRLLNIGSLLATEGTQNSHIFDRTNDHNLDWLVASTLLKNVNVSWDDYS